MKNASLVLNAVLLVAVIVLYVLHFSGGKGSSNSSLASSGPSNLKIAYINEDTVLKYYDFFKVNRDKLEATAKSFQQQLTTRQTSLQKEVESYQANRGNLTIGQAQAIEQSLQQKGQNYQMFEQSLGQQMQQEEARVSQELYDKIVAYLKEYSKERGIEVVLKYDRGSDLMFGGDSLDVSKDVIKGLNEAWKTESQTPVKSDTTKAK